jgi:pimeloyl-ACP methyl ester carboxylesterase
VSMFVLVPGAGGVAWFWHRLEPLLAAAGHDVIAVDLPADDDDAGLPEYAGLVVAAIGERDDAVVVAQSLGGFTALPVAARVPLRHLVLLNAMLPDPGETIGEWWGHVGASAARNAAAKAGGYEPGFDLETYFLHDVPEELYEGLAARERDETDAAWGQPCDFATWPDVPTTVLAGRDDRFFPLELQRRVARERQGFETEELPGGHLLALSEPEALATRLLALA